MDALCPPVHRPRCARVRPGDARDGPDATGGAASRLGRRSRCRDGLALARAGIRARGHYRHRVRDRFGRRAGPAARAAGTAVSTPTSSTSAPSTPSPSRAPRRARRRQRPRVGIHHVGPRDDDARQQPRPADQGAACQRARVLVRARRPRVRHQGRGDACCDRRRLEGRPGARQPAGRHGVSPSGGRREAGGPRRVAGGDGRPGGRARLAGGPASVEGRQARALVGRLRGGTRARGPAGRGGAA